MAHGNRAACSSVSGGLVAASVGAGNTRPGPGTKRPWLAPRRVAAGAAGGTSASMSIALIVGAAAAAAIASAAPARGRWASASTSSSVCSCSTNEAESASSCALAQEGGTRDALALLLPAIRNRNASYTPHGFTGLTTRALNRA